MVQIQQPVLNEIRAAAERIKEVVVNAPLVPLHSFEDRSTIL